MAKVFREGNYVVLGLCKTKIIGNNNDECGKGNVIRKGLNKNETNNKRVGLLMNITYTMCDRQEI